MLMSLRRVDVPRAAPACQTFGRHATCTMKVSHLKSSELIWDPKNVTHFPYVDDSLYTCLLNFVFDPARRFLTLTAACTSNRLRRENLSRFWDPRSVGKGGRMNDRERRTNDRERPRIRELPRGAYWGHSTQPERNILVETTNPQSEIKNSPGYLGFEVQILKFFKLQFYKSR